MMKYLKILLLVSLASLLLLGCVVPVERVSAPAEETSGAPAATAATQPAAQSDEAAAFPVTIEHHFGRTTILAKPERVVSLGFTDQDYLLALGVVPVGIRDWFGGQPNAVWPWARHLLNGAEPEVLSRELNFEHIARLQPDLIVAIYTSLTQEEYDLLSAIAPVVTAPAGLADYAITWQEQTRYTGQIVGQVANAEELVAQLEAKMAKASADHPEFAGTEYAFASVYGGEYYLYGERSTASRFLTTLGFVVPTDVLELTDNDNDYLVFSAERMDLVDRPLTLWSEGLTDAGVIALLENPLYTQLPVHTEGRDLFLGLDLYGGAFSFSSILSLDLLVDDLVPALALALDGDPATVPLLGAAATTAE
ncbi:MAG: iron-siderophore ABC transporter substrate-binding protein [Caldilineaceae bacterium]|nr:iron-siderophore ABC transporter substrate-binding protein [Caldilineaceae bacterium]